MKIKAKVRSLLLIVFFLGLVLTPTWVKPAADSIPQQLADLGPSTASAFPTVFYAAPTGTGLENCSSWANACSLQDALDIAENRDEIWVKAGLHLPGIRTFSTFSLVEGVKVYGGFAGTETARYQRDWLTNITVLSGDIDGDDLTDPNGVVTDTENLVGVNVNHVVSALGVSSSSVLDGFTITAGFVGNGDGAGIYNTGSPTLGNLVVSGNYAKDGGGLYNFNDSSPSLTKVTFSGNQAVNFGGGIYNRSGSNPTLTDVTILGNQAGVSGGGLYNTTESNPTLTNVTIHGNSAVEAGGGIYNLLSSPTLINCLISDNLSGIDGGGIYNDISSSPILTDVILSGNRAEGYGGDGGGIYNATNSSPLLTRVTLSGNYASSGGGGIQNDETNSPILTDVIVVGNEAGFTGGGILNRSGGSSTLINVLISGNLAQMGGGIINCNICQLNLTNVTIAGNRADYGGGMYNYSHLPVIENSIIWNNFALSGTGSLYNTDDTLPIIHNSNIQGCGGSSSWDPECGTDGGGNIDADPDIIHLTFWDNKDAGALIAEIRGMPEFAETSIAVWEALNNPGFLAEAGDNAVGILVSTTSTDFDRDTLAYQTLYQTYQEMYNEEPVSVFHGFSYDAAALLLKAIAQVAVLHEDGSLSVDPLAIRDVLYATLEYPGTTGSLTCSPYGDCSAVQGGNLYEFTSGDPDTFNPGPSDSLSSNPSQVWP